MRLAGLGVGARDDDAGDVHHVELEARRVEPLDLLVGGDQHLAALVAALLGARPLVLDVVAGHARLDEAADQVAHVRVAAVAGVGVGDDERPVVDGRRRGALRLAHAQALEVLVAVGGEQRPHQRRRLVGHLRERVAREVGPGVLARRALGRGRPAAEVDALDAHALHRHRLARRVGAEGGDALALGEELAQPGVERRRGLARHRVVVGDGAALLGHLAGGVEAGDAAEARAVEPALGGLDLRVERARGPDLGLENGHRVGPLLRAWLPPES